MRRSGVRRTLSHVVTKAVEVDPMNSFWATEQATQHIRQLHDEAAGGQLVHQASEAAKLDANAIASTRSPSGAAVVDARVHRFRGTLQRVRTALPRPTW
jgi:hypothetical protein